MLQRILTGAQKDEAIMKGLGGEREGRPFHDGNTQTALRGEI